jgi:CO/xanthine dehydrogenase Mo-binding subunit
MQNGCDQRRKIVAAEIWMAYEAGAFPGSRVGAGAMTIVASYNIPHFRIDAYDVVVNRPKTAAYRAPGASNAAFASETIVDELAERCGIDPIDFRIMNGVKEGDGQTAGPPAVRGKLHKSPPTRPGYRSVILVAASFNTNTPWVIASFQDQNRNRLSSDPRHRA